MSEGYKIWKVDEKFNIKRMNTLLETAELIGELEDRMTRIIETIEALGKEALGKVGIEGVLNQVLIGAENLETNIQVFEEVLEE